MVSSKPCTLKVERIDPIPSKLNVFVQYSRSALSLRGNVADPTQIARLFEETPEWPACAGSSEFRGFVRDVFHDFKKGLLRVP